jgi:hypothetical protein
LSLLGVTPTLFLSFALNSNFMPLESKLEKIISLSYSKLRRSLFIENFFFNENHLLPYLHTLYHRHQEAIKPAEKEKPVIMLKIYMV